MRNLFQIIWPSHNIGTLICGVEINKNTHVFLAADFCNKPKPRTFQQGKLVQNFDDDTPQIYLFINYLGVQLQSQIIST